MNLNEERKAPLRGKDLSTKREMVVQYISATAKSVSERLNSSALLLVSGCFDLFNLTLFFMACFVIQILCTCIFVIVSLCLSCSSHTSLIAIFTCFSHCFPL